MSHPRLRRVLLLALIATAFAAASASGALVEVDNLVLRADGGFQPQALPRHQFAPIDFQGHVDLSAKGGGKPSPLRQALIDFDRDGRLSVAGLPTCPPDSIDEATTEEARRICRGAIVGSGHVEALVSLESGEVRARSDLTVFNGPKLGGLPTAVLHARTTVPATQTYAIVVPIEQRRGSFRYRARLDVPPIAGGLGAITHIDVEIGRRYRAGGKQRSYASARCSDNVLQTHGRFSFEDGTVIDGLVEKFCFSK
ncbi:MAG TPA: hypothetical protein VHP56_10990 [Solirubrobacterales bacterium]|jgi:hypothetical protein|nr:hypothetical protein [Solirubrobacterales bacterium]